MMDTSTAAKRHLAKRLALSIGLLALGAAMAWTVSLALLQDAAIQAGLLPTPGTPLVSAGAFTSSPMWDAAKTLQQLANTAGLVGLLLLAGYGLADHFWDTLEAEDAGMDEVDA